ADGNYELHLSAFAHPPQANIRFAGSATSIYRLTLGHDPPTVGLPEPREAAGEDPQPVEIPCTLSARIDPPGDVDSYLFPARKGETIRFEIVAAELGSWMDAVLVIKNAKGEELKRQDDINTNTQHDVAIDWSVPADGEFVAEVHDLNGNGGSEITYRFHIEKPAPRFEATAAGGVWSVRAGEKSEIAVKVARRYGYGYEGELEVGIEGLAPGVTAAPAVVPEKGEAKLTLEAAAEAAPANLPIRIWAGPGGKPEERKPCRFELKGATTDAGDLLVNDTEQGWLSVLEKKEE
ncbi:MAG: hypothetical protein GWO24_01515, partial [Akkermansiaceae bacterium]|nr:hypothetical protein [Akkermansiaceae bacterium]NIV19216.1 hypothetical protein [Gammaproteobacteria bacterium]